MVSKGKEGTYKDLKEKSPFSSDKIHPYKVMLLLSLSGLTLLFIAISVAYLINTDNSSWQEIHIPPFFILSTALILFSSWSTEKAYRSYRLNREIPYRKWLIVTLISAVLFVVSQYLGWVNLRLDEVHVNSNMPSSYLYIISGLHVIHVLVGLIILGWFISKVVKQTQNALISIVHFTDPVQKLRLELIRIYWHFIDILWVYLILFFIINKILY